MLDNLLNVKAWALEETFFNRGYPIVMEMLRRGKDLKKLEALDPHKQAAEYEAAGGRWDGKIGAYIFSSSDKKNVAVIPIVGTLTKRGDLCSYGTREYINRIQKADASEDIAGIVLEVDSPGGSVDGTAELGLTIKQCAKPTVVFGDNVVASAAYWVASQANEIFGNITNPSNFGSIGTLFIYENYQKWIDDRIGEVRIIRAPQSVDKAKVNPFEPLPEESEAEIKAELKAITTDFVKTVKGGRGSRLSSGEENIFTGKMYTREQALEMGMIDAIGTLQEAIDRAAELASGPKSKSTKSNQSNMNFKFLSNFFGKAGDDATELTTEEQASLEDAEKKLEALHAERDGLRAIVDGAKAAAGIEEDEQLVATVESQVSTISDNEKEIADLNKKLEDTPAGPATTVVTDEDPTADASIRTSVDAELEKYSEV